MTRRLLASVVFLTLGGLGLAWSQAGPKQGTTRADAKVAAKKSTATTGVIAFRVRDDQTGYSVRSTVMLVGAKEGQHSPENLSTDEFGRLRLELPGGHYRYELSAPGYKGLQGDFYITSGRSLSWQVDVPPEAPPEELRPEVLDPQFRTGHALEYGYVVDAVTGKPLASVQIHLTAAQVATSTNERGYFALSVPTSNQAHEGVPVPAIDVLTAELPGYKTYLMKYAELTEGSGTFLRLDLEPGRGVAEHGQKPKWMLGPEELQDTQSAKPHASATPAPPELYAWIASRRALLPGGRDACAPSTPVDDLA
jgi:hypothetical protein